MSFRTFALLAATALFSPVATAQCTPQLVGSGQTFDIGVGNESRLVYWDPDAAGPASPMVLMPWVFYVLGTNPNNNTSLLAWTPDTGKFNRSILLPTGTFRGLYVAPNNDLLIYGDFNSPDSFRYSVGRYNGSTWIPIGNNLNGDARGVAVSPTGEMIAIGANVQDSPNPSNIVRFDGTTWSQIGTASTPSAVLADVNRIVSLPSGDFIVAGTFETVNGVPARNIARWNGATWSAMGAGSQTKVTDLDVAPDGKLYACGTFTDITGTSVALAFWTGTAWQGAGNPSNFNVSTGQALAIAPDGDLITPKAVTGGYRMYRRDNGVWGFVTGTFTPTYVSDPFTDILVLPNGDVLVLGEFDAVDGVRFPHLAIRRQGSTKWEKIVFGFPNVNYGMLALDNSDVLVWSTSQTDDGPVRDIARFDGERWQDASAGFADVPDRRVSGKIIRRSNGELVACWGSGSLSTYRLYSLTGSTWTPWTPEFQGAVRDMASTPDGGLIVVGEFLSIGGVSAQRVARWNGVTWQPMGPGLNGNVWEVEVTQAGEIRVMGDFTSSGATPIAGVARWTGSSWVQLGTNAPPDFYERVRGSAMKPNGEWHVSRQLQTGAFTSIRTNWWLDGSTWRQIPNDATYAFPMLTPDGEIVYLSEQPRLPYRWDNGTFVRWGTEYNFETADIRTIVRAPNGDISFAGLITDNNQTFYGRFAQWITCPASCDSIDFNNNQVFPEDQDVIDFFTVLAGGTCPTCNDIDFNNNQVFPEDQDVIDFFTVLAGGPCP